MKRAVPSAQAFMNDPEWASFLSPVQTGGPRCKLMPHADCSPLDVTAAAHHLQPGGTLGQMKDYEARAGQVDMLRAIVRAYNDRCHLMVEAGTGVGKSLAYLVPSVLWSYLNDTPVVISTATRNLQSQLTQADLPRAAHVLGSDSAKLRWAVLKGRTNYLCLRALDEYMQSGWFTLTPNEQEDFTHLMAWLYETEDGDLDDFGCEALRPHLTCPSEDCWGKACPYANRCFIAKARTRALRAHIIVANHALVLAEAANPGSGLLPAYGQLVFDEAHNLEDIATDYFSYELSKPVLTQLMGRLVRTGRTRRGRTPRMRGLLGAVGRQLEHGAVEDASIVEELRELVNRAYVQTRFVLSAADELFSVLKGLFAPAMKTASVIRYRTLPPQFAAAASSAPAVRIRQYALDHLFTSYTAGMWDEAQLNTHATALEEALGRLQGIVQSLATLLKESAEEDGPPLFADLAIQAESIVSQFTLFILEMKCVLEGADGERVFWAEKMSATKRNHTENYIRLVGAPLSVAKEMKRCFYDIKDSVVLCSATLRAGDRFDYMAHKLGLDYAAADQPEENGASVRVRALVAASPFDYLRQALVLAPDCLPDPGDAAYAENLAPFLADLFFAVHGRGLVLFTSYELMHRVETLARERFEACGLRLLAQGGEFSREQMVAELRADSDTVLFGAQSFWEGVDVPGPALSCVVIVRLPFPQVGEPVTAARCARVVEQGGSEFRDFMLPEALIRFRQGFGRLVRSRRDRGVVVITDPRLARKNYGAAFRKSITASVHVVSTLDETLARAAAFLDDKE